MKITTVRYTLVAAGLLLAALASSSSAQDKDKEAPATLIVTVPADDADLYIEGVKTKQAGKVTRKFVSPKLESGKEYEYTVVAKWEPNNYTKITRTRKATVKAGQETTLDMTKKDDAQPDNIVIRYVPTPDQVVEAMLKLGKVGKGDVVFDLGCGDGRIPITAVSKFMAKKGVGVDLDPERIKECNEGAKKAGVVDKTEFRMGDVMKVKDLGTANVVTMYLADELNEQLAPILKKTLKPGSRIVTHRFLMGDWKPEKTEKIDVDGEEYLIHLWTIKGDKKEEDKKKEDKEKD